MFSRLCSPGVAMLAVALLALALIPAAAGPGITVTVDEVLPAMYTGVDNPCTTATENITLQGTYVTPQGEGPFAFHITGSVRFSANGTTSANLRIYSYLSGSDTTGGIYVSQHRSNAYGTITPGAPRDFRGYFVVNPLDATTPHFYLFVRFRVSSKSEYDAGLPIVTFYDPYNDNPYGFDGTQC